MREEPQNGLNAIILLIFSIFSGFTTFPANVRPGKVSKDAKGANIRGGGGD